jgi:hypothetical protein
VNSITEESFDYQRALAIAGFSRYEEYLASEHWSNIRKLWVISGYPRCCIGCTNQSYQLHHLTYTRLGHESLTDLLPLCNRCHSKVHLASKERFVALENFEQILLSDLWDTRAVGDRLTELRSCWSTLPLGDLNARSSLVPRRVLAQCHTCGKRGWQNDTRCRKCGVDTEAVLDWR